MSTPSSRPSARGTVLALIGIVLMAFSLRSAVAALSPLYAYVQEDFAVPAWVAGLIGTAPPVCFAVFGLVTPALERRFGLERLAAASMAVVAVALVGRALAPDAAGLLAGTAVLFAAVGVANVITPPLLKASFPDRIGTMTALYTAILAVAAFVPPLIAVPVADAAGWRFSIGLWSVFAAAALVPWVVRSRSQRGATGSPEPDDAAPASGVLRRLLRLPLVWALIVSFAASAGSVYTAFAWLPQILVDVAGTSLAEAGVLLSVFGLVGLPLGLLVPLVVARLGRVGPVYAVAIAAGFVGIAGLVFAPSAAPLLWVVLFGMPQAMFALVLVLVQQRSRTREGTVGLSGLSQSIGYAIAATVPFLFGVLHEATGAWNLPLGLFAVLLLCAVPAGIVVARGGTVEDAWERRHGTW